jgi:excisionase family DNA binding protein
MKLRDARFVRDMCGFKSVARVYEAARIGLIPCVRIGRQVRFDEDRLKRWVEEGGTSEAFEARDPSNAVIQPGQGRSDQSRDRLKG